MSMLIQEARFNDPQVVELIRLHLDGMRASSPSDSVFALDMSGLQHPDVSLRVAYIDARVAGMGAIKHLDRACAELKSMRTHPDFLRRGVGSAILEHLLSLAYERGYRRVSLETGRGPTFEPALAMYRNRGFRAGPAFGDYQAGPFSQFFHIDLS